uniref:30S ribosomal protein S18 n=1 Tax=Nephromyces sp. ex Molgula occidentalis TaxID=2544991 RepID=A0A5C1H854_9APIC|nr:hypothetical protein [Nephromyces sp. ex Molgula occidentalis]
MKEDIKYLHNFSLKKNKHLTLFLTKYARLKNYNSININKKKYKIWIKIIKQFRYLGLFPFIKQNFLQLN